MKLNFIRLSAKQRGNDLWAGVVGWIQSAKPGTVQLALFSIAVPVRLLQYSALSAVTLTKQNHSRASDPAALSL
jgi:hypothetical protein